MSLSQEDAPLPCDGDRILILKQPWLDLILHGRKTLEIRSRRMKPGPYYLGMRGRIYGLVYLGTCFEIQNRTDWQRLRHQHHVPGKETPYTRTWALPILEVRSMSQGAPYQHPRGAIGVVRYRAA